MQLFIAVQLAKTFQDVFAPLIEEIPGFTWTPLHRLHVPLRVLGQVDNPHLRVLREKLDAVRQETFLVSLHGVAVSPSPERQAWIRIVDPDLFKLRLLAKRIDEAVLASGLTVDVSSVSQRVLIAEYQKDASDRARAWARAHSGYRPLTIPVSEFVLFSDEPDIGGLGYKVIDRFHLRRLRTQSDVGEPI